MSEIVEEISYIPLETKPDCLLGDVNPGLDPPVFTDDYIFIQYGSILFQFDGNGKFIRKVNSEGQGPEECSVRCFTVDEKSRLVCLFDNFTLSTKIFDFDGNFHSSFKNPFLEEPSTNIPWRMDIDGRGNLVYIFANIRGDMEYKYVVTDKTGNFLYKCPNYDLYNNERRVSLMILNPSPLHSYDNFLYYDSRVNDTIFKINDDYSCSPAYIIKLPGRVTLEENVKRGTRELSSFDLSNRFFHESTRQDARSIYIYNSVNGKFFLTLYDKQTGELTENINTTLRNDYDGGMDIDMIPYMQNENIFVFLFHPFEMKEKLTEEHFKEVKVAYPAKRDALKSMLDNLQDDDNPVLMIVKLK